MATQPIYQPWAQWCLDHHLKSLVWLVQVLVLLLALVCLIGDTLMCWFQYQIQYGRAMYHTHWPYWKKELQGVLQDFVTLWRQ
jgi:hypothetical protein